MKKILQFLFVLSILLTYNSLYVINAKSETIPDYYNEIITGQEIFTSNIYKTEVFETINYKYVCVYGLENDDDFDFKTIKYNYLQDNLVPYGRLIFSGKELTLYNENSHCTYNISIIFFVNNDNPFDLNGESNGVGKRIATQLKELGADIYKYINLPEPIELQEIEPTLVNYIILYKYLNYDFALPADQNFDLNDDGKVDIIDNVILKRRILNNN